MSSNSKKNGLPVRSKSGLFSSGLPGIVPGPALSTTPDASLSAAFRHVLGSTPDSPHLPSSMLKRGQELAKRSKTEKPGGLAKTYSGKPHIGPRSGHK